MAVSLWNEKDRVFRRIHDATDLLILSDFDGTLVPLQNNPEDCRLDGDTRDVLSRLAQYASTQVGVVSGRKLSDIQSRVAVAGILYAGNHGLEIEGPGFSFLHAEAASRSELVQRAAVHLHQRVAHFPGVWLENKRLSATLHFRTVDALLRPHLVDLMGAFLGDPNQLSGLVSIRHGKDVVEIRPDVDWNKGHAVAWLAKRLEVTSPLVIYLGDDQTDQDVFHSLKSGITISVGDFDHSGAEYFVSDHQEVTTFLKQLADLLSRRNASLNEPGG